MVSVIGPVPEKICQVDDPLVVEIGLDDEHGDAKRRRQQADLDGDDRDQPEPDQVHAEPFEHRNDEGQHDQHDRDGIEEAAEDDDHDEIADAGSAEG